MKLLKQMLQMNGKETRQKEQVVKRAIYDIVFDGDEVEKIFQIIYEQEEY